MLTRKIGLLTFGLAILVGQATRGDDTEAREDPPPSFPVLAGIGVALSTTDTGPQVGIVVPGSPAEKSGKLNQGDYLLSVRDGERTIDLNGKPLGEVVSLLRGPVGTMVTLEVLSGGSGSRFFVTLEREAFPMLGRMTYDDLIGKPLPAIRLSALDQSSEVVLSDYAGQVVVIDFWASWCGTCYAPVDEMQEIARAHPEWRDRVTLLTATVDTDLRAAAKVVEARTWTETTHLTLAPEELEAFKIVAIPAVIIISPDGTVAAAGESHAIAIEKEVSKLLRRCATDRPREP